MSPNAQGYSSLRVRSYIYRLPLFTRLIISVILLVSVLAFLPLWDLRQWGSLIPDQISLQTSYRINTYPFVHVNLLHVLCNILALTPLLERFESEYGTLTSLALFFGPLTTFPAFLYILVEKFILRGNAAVMGASVWVFLLLGMEAMRAYRTQPYLTIGPYSTSIPSWTAPLILTLLVKQLVPSTSLLGHVCGVVIGYGGGLGYLKFLSPPEKVLRWIESRLNLSARLPHYVSVDQKTYGRFGVLPSSNVATGPGEQLQQR